MDDDIDLVACIRDVVADCAPLSGAAALLILPVPLWVAFATAIVLAQPR